MKKISLAIPTRNRPEMTIEVFEKILHDYRIGEIVISDDGVFADERSKHEASR